MPLACKLPTIPPTASRLMDRRQASHEDDPVISQLELSELDFFESSLLSPLPKLSGHVTQEAITDDNLPGCWYRRTAGCFALSVIIVGFLAKRPQERGPWLDRSSFRVTIPDL